ncbi:MAG: beta-N-acetylhexosaminidase [archaeon GB-1867-035]|nr:beta-N-acetylhexosaminidase [Candidatus Culexmicrobium profundum]
MEVDLNFLSGQLFMVGFKGTEFTGEHEDLLKTLKPSGIILFRRNVVNPRQVGELIGDFQSYAKKIGLPPLFVSIDYEGGIIIRISGGVTPIPSAMAISATRRVESARIVAEIAARELRAMGINVNLAPVVDVNSNPLNPIIGVRSFGDDPLEVARFGEVYIKSLQSNGVMAVAKHFPGHGDTSVDSHLDLPVLDLDLDVMLRRELVPFKAAIDAGVSAIMTAHIAYPRIDSSNLPATLSKTIITDLLRRRLNFNGIVMTDALEMKAIYDRFSPREIAVLALNAGVDLLLPCNDYDFMLSLKDEIVRGVRDGEISRDRLMDAYLKLNEFRGKFNLYSYKFNPEYLSVIGCRRHRDAVSNIYMSSLTLVKNEGVLPLDGDLVSMGIVIPKIVVDRFLGLDDFYLWFDNILSEYCGDIRVFTYEVNPSIEAVNTISEGLRDCEVNLVFTYNALLNRGQVDLVERLMGLGDLIVVASRDPYDILAFPGVKYYIATYGLNRFQLEFLIRALFDELSFRGGLPVNINGLFSRAPLSVD